MASTEAVVRPRPDFKVASQRPQFILYLMVKMHLDQGHGLGYI